MQTDGVGHSFEVPLQDFMDAGKIFHQVLNTSLHRM